MDRRQFFRLGFDKAIQSVARSVEATVERQALRWFRPPYAQRELAFLLSCTRCDQCILACPHQVLFALPLEVGPKAMGTPAMDLLDHACRLCADWPCVAACEPGALRLPTVAPGESPPLPHLAQVRIDPNQCLPYQGPECGACGSVCPIPGALRWHGPRPSVDESLCVGCARCLEACITQPKAVVVGTLNRESAHAITEPVA